jgi:hypothetical protein
MEPPIIKFKIYKNNRNENQWEKIHTTKKLNIYKTMEITHYLI